VTGIDGVEILRIATALDPRYKTLRCLSTEDKGEIWTAIAAKLSAAVDAEAHTEQLRVSHTDDDFDTVCEPMNKRIRLMDSDSDTDEPGETTTEEIAHFKAEKKLPDGENPLLWWKTNEHRYFLHWRDWQRMLCVYQRHQCPARDCSVLPDTSSTRDVCRWIHQP